MGNDVLEQTLTATNTGSEAFELTAALHTYFSISSIDKVLIWPPCYSTDVSEVPKVACTPQDAYFGVSLIDRVLKRPPSLMLPPLVFTNLQRLHGQNRCSLCQD